MRESVAKKTKFYTKNFKQNLHFKIWENLYQKITRISNFVPKILQNIFISKYEKICAKKKEILYEKFYAKSFHNMGKFLPKNKKKPNVVPKILRKIFISKYERIWTQKKKTNFVHKILHKILVSWGKKFSKRQKMFVPIKKVEKYYNTKF